MGRQNTRPPLLLIRSSKYTIRVKAKMIIVINGSGVGQNLLRLLSKYINYHYHSNERTRAFSSATLISLYSQQQQVRFLEFLVCFCKMVSLYLLILFYFILLILFLWIYVVDLGENQSFLIIKLKYIANPVRIIGSIVLDLDFESSVGAFRI